MSEFRYNSRMQIETGFDNSIDHSLFGNWKNPEYQLICQDEERYYRDLENNESDFEEYKQILNKNQTL